jgi:hypothetical protein
MKNIIEIFKKIGYGLPENYFDESEKNFFQWNQELEKINFNQLRKINEELKKNDTEIKKLNAIRENILLEESEGKKINIKMLVKTLFSIKSLEMQNNFSSEKINYFKRTLAEIGKTGGRPKTVDYSTLLKPYGLLGTQLISNLRLKYYLFKNPDYFKGMSEKEKISIINEQTFYHFSSSYPFLEDAILGLAYFHNPIEITNDFYIYEVTLNEFIKQAGLTGKDKTRFLEFLNKTFLDDRVFKAPIIKVQDDRLYVKYETILNMDFSIRLEDSNTDIKIYLNRGIFKTIVGDDKRKFIYYPAHLNKRLIQATHGNYDRRIRSLFDHIQRDLEFSGVSQKKSIASIMASIGYSKAFQNLDTFEINITRVKKFLEKALPAINSIGVVGKNKQYKTMVKKVEVNQKKTPEEIKRFTIAYKIEGTYLIFRRLKQI